MTDENVLLGHIIATNPHAVAAWFDQRTSPPTLHIALNHAEPLPELKIPAEIAALPLIIQKTGPLNTLITLATDEEPSNIHQICQNEPVSLGTQIQPAGAPWLGTAGSPMKWLDAGGEPHWGILSNWHVMADGGEQIGRPIHQPTATQPAIAKLAAWCGPKPDQANQCDAAIADAKIGDFHTIAPNLLGIGPIGSGELPASVGLAVIKSGRTTAVTRGRCSAVGAAVRVGYGDFTAAFIDQDLFTPVNGPFSAAGDSGSLIVDQLEHRPCSLLFAGSSELTVGNPMRHVVEALNLVFPFP